MNGRQHFERLVQDLKAGRRPPGEVLQWLIEGKRLWEQDPRVTLEGAFGLVRSREAVYMRDALIGQAVSRMPDGWTIAEKIRQVKRIAKKLEPYRSDPDQFGWRDVPAWYQEIFLAMEHAPIPKARQLRKVCTQSEKCKKPVPIMNHRNLDQKEK